MSRVQVDNQMTKVLILMPDMEFLMKKFDEMPVEHRHIGRHVLTDPQSLRITDLRNGWTYAIKTPATTAEQDELIEGKAR